MEEDAWIQSTSGRVLVSLSKEVSYGKREQVWLLPAAGSQEEDATSQPYQLRDEMILLCVETAQEERERERKRDLLLLILNAMTAGGARLDHDVV